MTPLLKAAYKGDLVMVQYLVAHGADIKSRDNEGGTAFHVVAEDPEIVQFLITKGAEPNARDGAGNTPLHNIGLWTGDAKDVGITNALLSAGADVNAKNEEGQTPLIKVLKADADCAILFGLGSALPSIDALLSAGADPSVKDKNGNSALSLAQEIRKNCSTHGDSPEQLAASRAAVAALIRLANRATRK